MRNAETPGMSMRWITSIDENGRTRLESRWDANSATDLPKAA